MAAFHIDWKNLQQQVALPCGFYLQLNGGEARINGAEIELSGRLAPSLQLRFGLGYEKTNIDDPGVLADLGVFAGERILETPALTASVAGVYTWPLNERYDGFVAADYSYTGNSISLLNGGSGLTETRPSFSLANLRFGVQHEKQELSLNIGYAQFSSAGVVMPQVATLQPFTVMIQYKNNF
jgi:outer membrane receptor protein involved in Fe transport